MKDVQKNPGDEEDAADGVQNAGAVLADELLWILASQVLQMDFPQESYFLVINSLPLLVLKKKIDHTHETIPLKPYMVYTFRSLEVDYVLFMPLVSQNKAYPVNFADVTNC